MLFNISIYSCSMADMDTKYQQSIIYKPAIHMHETINHTNNHWDSLHVIFHQEKVFPNHESPQATQYFNLELKKSSYRNACNNLKLLDTNIALQIFLNLN